MKAEEPAAAGANKLLEMEIDASARSFRIAANLCTNVARASVGGSSRSKIKSRMGGRAVEGTGLENRQAL